MKPRLLDLFCGAGGAAMGYHRAGFEVVGVDAEPQPDYPFEFHRCDALGVLDGLTMRPRNFFLGRPDAIHASPPCQAFSDMKVMWNAREHEDLLTPTRELLEEIGLPYVIENVPGAPMRQPVVLCGSSLGLGVTKYDRELRRHRLFETNWPMLVAPCAHRKATIGIYGDHARDRRRVDGKSRGVDFPDTEKLELGREALGMPWATRWKSLSQAIPPAYTELIGHQLMQHITATRKEAA